VLQKVAGELQAVQLEKQAVEAQWRDAEREWAGQLTTYQESLARLQGELAAAQEAHHTDRDQAQASLQLGLELEKERGRLAGLGAYSIVIEDWGLVALIYRGLGSCSIDIYGTAKGHPATYALSTKLGNLSYYQIIFCLHYFNIKVQLIHNKE